MKLLLSLFFTLISVSASAQFTCSTPERVYPPVTAQMLDRTPDGVLCSRVWVQVDADVVADKGLQGASEYARNLMAEVAVPYADEEIELSFTYDFLTTEQYTDGNSLELLNQFRDANPVFDGDVAILISYKASGGVAYVDVACGVTPYRYGFASIRGQFIPFRDGFSWDVEVVAHELGHSYGSPHTQSCAWERDGLTNQSIDGCFGNGDLCDPGPIPSGGGTIMSYCHLSSVGINFDKGFHPQVAALMRANIYDRCTTCDNPDGPEDPDPPVVTCSDNTVFLGLITDIFPGQTSYTVTDAFGAVIHQRGPFADSLAGEFIGDTLCLADGCYIYTITDVDGLAPHPKFPCVEGLYRVGDPFGEFGSGQDFTGSETVRICVGDYDEPGGCEPKGPYRDSLQSYANQDRTGGVSVFGENFFKLSGNTWKVQPLSYTVTPLTVLYAEVKVEQLGEIHAFAFSINPSGISPSTTLRFAGTQAWGREVAQVPIGEWVDIAIPVGQLIPNVEYSHLGFVNDYDPDGVAVTGFRNIELCEDGTGGLRASVPKAEGTFVDEMPEGYFSPFKIRGQGGFPSVKNHALGCNAGQVLLTDPPQYPPCTCGLDKTVVEDIIIIRPIPNPVTDTLILPAPDAWLLFTAAGKLIEIGHGDRINMSLLPPGLYLVWQAGRTHKIVKS